MQPAVQHDVIATLIIIIIVWALVTGAESVPLAPVGGSVNGRQANGGLVHPGQQH